MSEDVWDPSQENSSWFECRGAVTRPLDELSAPIFELTQYQRSRFDALVSHLLSRRIEPNLNAARIIVPRTMSLESAGAQNRAVVTKTESISLGDPCHVVLGACYR